MYGERKRDPLPAPAMCLHCGWSGTPNHKMLRDEHGDVSLVLSQKPCPKCGAQTIQLNDAKPLPIQIITAVRDADLTDDELLDLADAVREAPSDTTPRELGERVPSASKIISIASRGGEHWIELLALVLATIAFYVSHTDAQQAHRDAQQASELAHQDAQQAHQDAERARQDDGQNERQNAREATRKTSSLSDEDVRRIALQIEAELERHSTP